MTAPLQYGTPPPRDPTAVMGRRTLAWLADLLLFLAVAAAGTASMGEYVTGVGGFDDPCQALEEQAEAEGRNIGACFDFRDLGFDVADSNDRVYVLSETDAGVQTLLSLGWFALFVVLQGVTGGSPGKLLFGLRVVDQQGNRCGIGKSLGRTLMWIVDAAPWLIPLVGPITAFTSTGHRRVGDLAAGTYVVASSSVGQPVAPGAVPAPYGQPTWGAAPPTSPPPPGQGWAPPATPASPPPSSSASGSTPPATASGRWSSPISPEEPDLDIRELGVPHPTERADEAPPTVHADPDWSRTPDAAPEEQPAEPEAPTWSAPTLPDVEEPATDWQPPTTPGPDWEAGPTGEQSPPEPAPFAAPGADAAAPPPSTPGAEAPPPTAPAAPRYELPPPQWDTARNTYIQWDPNRQAWLQWDTARERWKPIDT